jgi:hypothetical protein
LTTINQYTFEGCSGLTNIIIPKGITSIGNYAFYNCTGLTSVIISKTVNSLGNNAFSLCYSLLKVYFQGNAPSYTLNSLFLGSPETLKVYRYSIASGFSSPSGTVLFDGRQILLIDSNIHQGLQTFGFLNTSSGKVSIKKTSTGSGKINLKKS